jgi:hypothetical protein
MASVLERPQAVSSAHAGACPRGGCSATETVGTPGAEDLP